MINPTIVEASYVLIKRPAGKFYLAIWRMDGQQFVSRKVFRRATEALGYAQRVLDRWKRLYDVAIVKMAQEPA